MYDGPAFAPALGVQQLTASQAATLLPLDSEGQEHDASYYRGWTGLPEHSTVTQDLPHAVVRAVQPHRPVRAGYVRARSGLDGERQLLAVKPQSLLCYSVDKFVLAVS